jgi:hypothetical protein
MSQKEVFEKSYIEVLAFIKHEDEKINRVLTALSFLTTAAAVLFVFGAREEEAKRDFFFLHGQVHAPDFFFSAFLISLALALGSAIAAVDPTSHYPHFMAATRKRKGSVLFHGIISERTDWWDSLKALRDAELDSLLVESYHEDAKRLARRARHKTQRFAECNAFVHVAVASLALLGASRLGFFSELQRWSLMAVILGAAAALPAWDLLSLWRLSFPDIGKGYRSKEAIVREGLAFLGPTILVTWILIGVAVPLQAEPETAGYALLSPLVLRLVAVSVAKRAWVAFTIPSVWAAGGVALGIIMGILNL